MPKHSAKPTKNMLIYPRIGIVKRVDDQHRMGRLWAWIPEFTSPEDEPTGWILCNYCSPFAGTTPREDTSAESLEAFESTQQSYGFWAVPPDIGNEIIIIFPGGELKNAKWIGCLFKEFANKMIPGVAADINNLTDNGKALPVAEYNKNQPSATDPIDISRPEHTTRLDGISRQGLINDPIRGTTTSSAQRESPSQVFGILTPGPRSLESGKRSGGSSFVMDDGDESEHITLMTKSGAKIKIDETNELIYVINKPGTAWIQLDKYGNIDIFGAQNISMRAQGDLNLRADGNVNIEAGNNVNIKAARDASSGEIVGEGKGDGGDINIEANANVDILASSGKIKESAALGDIILFAAKNFKTTAIKDTMIVTMGKTAIQSVSDINIATTIGDINLFSAKNLKTTAKAKTSFTSTTTMDMDTGTITVKSDNFKLDGGGTISNTGDIVTDGKCSASNYSADIDLNTLDSHDHTYLPNNSNTVTKTTLNPSGEDLASPAMVSPPDVTIPSTLLAPSEPTLSMPKFPKINVLRDFKDEKRYRRNAAGVASIVTRFPTFEPYPEHEGFNSESIEITGSTAPGVSASAFKTAIVTAEQADITLSVDASGSLIPEIDIGSIVNDAIPPGGSTNGT